MSALTLPVLELNRNWTPLRFTTVKDAMVKVAKGVAEIISREGDAYPTYSFRDWQELSALRAQFEPDQHDWIGTVKSKIAVPRIIRLLTYGQTKRHRIRLTRRNVYQRDNYTCQYTGQKLPASELNLDHIIPLSRGGKTTWDNVVCCSIEVNQRKANKTPAEAGLTLIRQPREPKLHEISLQKVKVRYTDWDAFVSDAYWNTELKD